MSSRDRTFTTKPTQTTTFLRKSPRGAFFNGEKGDKIGYITGYTPSETDKFVKATTNLKGITQYIENRKQVAIGMKDLALVWSETSTVGHGVIDRHDSVFDEVMATKGTTAKVPCQLIEAGKFRNGAKRWWCQSHQCAYGTKADLARECCGSAGDEVTVLKNPPYIEDGDVAIWYACLPAIYLGDKRRKFSEGIHVHRWEGGTKKVDATFPAVVLDRGIAQFAITPTVARSRLLAMVDGIDQEEALCKKCYFLHNDLGHFAKNPHRMHLCGRCGGTFYTKTHNTCNSLVALPTTPQTKDPEAELILSSYQYSAIAIWASTPAIYTQRPQIKDSIHVHAWKGKEKVVDESFARVVLDGVELQRDELLAAMLGRDDWSKKDIYTQRRIH